MKRHPSSPRQFGLIPISITGIGMGTPVFLDCTDAVAPKLLIQDAANDQDRSGWVQIQIDDELPLQFHSEQGATCLENDLLYGISLPAHMPIVAKKEKIAANATLLIERISEFPYAARQIARFCGLSDEEMRLTNIIEEMASTQLADPPKILSEIKSFIEYDFREKRKSFFQAFLSNSIDSLYDYVRVRFESLASRFDAELSLEVRNWAADLGMLGPAPTAEEMSVFVEGIGPAVGIAYAFNSSLGATSLFSASRKGVLSLSSEIGGACDADEARWELCSRFDDNPTEKSVQYQYLQVNVYGNFLDLSDWDFSEHVDVHSITISIANLAREKGYDGIIWRKTSGLNEAFEVVSFNTSVISSIYAAGIYQMNIATNGARTWEPYHIYA